MKELKEEGNDMYKEKEFSGAGDMYTAALLVGKALLERAPRMLDAKLVSIIFSNRAASFIKMVRLMENCRDIYLRFG